MKIIKSVRENKVGNLECELLNGKDWGAHTMPPSAEYEIHKDSKWQGVAPYVEPVKTNDQLIAEIDLELSSLDATPRMLSGALMGDQWAKDKIADIETKQAALRDKRKALL